MTRRFLAPLGCLVTLCAGFALAGDDVADAIRKLQKGKKAEDRMTAAKFLGGQADPAAIEALAQALLDRDPLVRETAASALWETGANAKAAEPALRKALEDSDPDVVAGAAGALEVMGVDAKELAAARRVALGYALRHARPSEYHTAFLLARGLIGIDPAAVVVPGLLPYLGVVSAAMEEKPRGWLEHSDEVQTAAKALEEVTGTQDRTAIPFLLDELDRSPASAPSLLGALGMYKPSPEGFAQALVAQMHSRYTRARHAAAGQCRSLTSDADVASCAAGAAALTRDSDQSVRIEAMNALQTAGARAVASVPDVVGVLEQDPSADARAYAAETLGEIGEASQAVAQKVKAQVAEQAKGPLATAMMAGDGKVAVKAVAAYNRLWLKTSEAVATLVQVAESAASVAARERALAALRNRQGQARPFLERVRALSQSAEGNVGADARNAVASIERGGPGSPNPVMTAAPAGTAARLDPGAEARGLSKLRELDIPFDESGFYQALMEAQPQVVRAFLDAGMSPSHPFPKDDARHPLMVLFFYRACRANQPTSAAAIEIAKDLLAAGANVNQTDDNGMTPMMFAALSCDGPTVRLLLAAGAKLRTIARGNKVTALTNALGLNNQAAEELIASGARLDPEDVKDYADIFKNDPKTLALVKKATP